MTSEKSTNLILPDSVAEVRSNPASLDLDVDPREYVYKVVRQSGTSFYWAMRLLSQERRDAIYSIYAFCREVDDIADEPGETDAKLRALDGWREEIGRLYDGKPEWPVTRALLESVDRFDLPQEELLAVIDGMEIDAPPTVRMESVGDLLGYCRKVAGAVGMLSIHAFGMTRKPAPRIAVALGNALQLTNILRDVSEDAKIQRLYVPLDILRENGIGEKSLDRIITHPAFAQSCLDMAKMAHEFYGEADALLSGIRGRLMQPAVIMMKVYRETFDRLEKRGWEKLAAPVSVSKARKLWLAIRHGLF